MSKSKIYVYCPAEKVTGGAELLHQIVDVLNNHGYDAYVVYFNGLNCRVPDDYKKYNIKLSSSIEDTAENIVILFEGYFFPLSFIKNAKIVLWWLSVDNFYRCQCSRVSLNDLKDYSIRMFCKEFVKKILGKREDYICSLKALSQDNRVVLNAFQSEYAKDFLIKQKFSNLYPLKDYINDEYVYDRTLMQRKENIVIYNPKKGWIFTRKLIASSPDIKWVPIQNMNRTQVKETMQKAKVYVDFGFHPGKDRIPREAAMCGCCVITGKQGSAGFYGDVPINEKEYKFNQKNKDIPKILEKIHYLLDNYDFSIDDFAHYRECIAKEKSEFVQDALNIAEKLCE